MMLVGVGRFGRCWILSILFRWLVGGRSLRLLWLLVVMGEHHRGGLSRIGYGRWFGGRGLHRMVFCLGTPTWTVSPRGRLQHLGVGGGGWRR